MTEMANICKSRCLVTPIRPHKNGQVRRTKKKIYKWAKKKGKKHVFANEEISSILV